VLRADRQQSARLLRDRRGQEPWSVRDLSRQAAGLLFGRLATRRDEGREYP